MWTGNSPNGIEGEIVLDVEIAGTMPALRFGESNQRSYGVEEGIAQLRARTVVQAFAIAVDALTLEAVAGVKLYLGLQSLIGCGSVPDDGADEADVGVGKRAASQRQR